MKTKPILGAVVFAAVIIAGLLVSGSGKEPIITRQTEGCGIDERQITLRTNYEDKELAIYQRNSMNVDLVGNENYSESGILLINKSNNSECEKILKITDPPGISAKNNPYELAYDDEGIYVLVVDQNGAGSGEGTAKILKSTNLGKSWEQVNCFYFVPEKNPGIESLISNPPNTEKNSNCSNLVIEGSER